MFAEWRRFVFRHEIRNFKDRYLIVFDRQSFHDTWRSFIILFKSGKKIGEIDSPTQRAFKPAVLNRKSLYPLGVLGELEVHEFM